METFEEKAKRLPQNIKDQLESYMNVVLGISSLDSFRSEIEKELDLRLENSQSNAQSAEKVLNDLASKYGLNRKD